MATPVSGISLANLIKASPFLTKALTPIANTYYKFTAYQQIGFRYDDLIPEENLAMIKALKRLSPKEHADRVYRMRVASQCSMSHTLLPKEQWTTLDQVCISMWMGGRARRGEGVRKGCLDHVQLKKEDG
ncbi:hypothetical protein G7K_2654-t1 [Saitoella complicata NRRL Y-17804]|uniref:Complex III subunit 7 n=1 Tax=Saitoella complicata (strain BCRC 22490 / CBS 7301 / JCM 7358 / NBRC 10748 / NRRL Y-17804) TaxID=698492 RepID=A0A0E9NFM0_SAICN|nr:hypothetical protein G7K_2654-t1 [Saitoella complicata NRRL Y-17804]